VTTGNGTLLPKGDQLIADVVSITGMELTGGAADDSLHNGLGLVKKTDVYTLQMSYSDAGMGSMEAVYAATGKIQLVYLNPGADNAYGTSDDQWQNAVVGNFGSPGTDAYVNYQGSWDNFVLYEDNLHGVNFVENNLGLFLSSWGVDTANNDVWAVLNHNSQFSVVPEPVSLGLLALGAVGLLSRRRRRVA